MKCIVRNERNWRSARKIILDPRMISKANKIRIFTLNFLCWLTLYNKRTIKITKSHWCINLPQEMMPRSSFLFELQIIWDFYRWLAGWLAGCPPPFSLMITYYLSVVNLNNDWWTVVMCISNIPASSKCIKKHDWSGGPSPSIGKSIWIPPHTPVASAQSTWTTLEDVRVTRLWRQFPFL